MLNKEKEVIFESDDVTEVIDKVKELFGQCERNMINNQSEFVERFLELSLFYWLFSPLNSEMICIFPYFCPYAESARKIREFFI